MTLSRRFKDVMEDYNGVQENYRDKNKDRIQKQLQYGKMGYHIARTIDGVLIWQCAKIVMQICYLCLHSLSSFPSLCMHVIDNFNSPNQLHVLVSHCPVHVWFPCTLTRN